MILQLLYSVIVRCIFSKRYFEINTVMGVSWAHSFLFVFVIFSCDQAALRMAISVCLSVCLSVCDTFLTMFLSSYHHEIFRSCYQWQKWRPCKRSRSEKVPYCFSRSSVKFQGHTALKSVEFDPYWVFPDCNSSLKSPMATKWCTKLKVV